MSELEIKAPFDGWKWRSTRRVSPKRWTHIGWQSLFGMAFRCREAFQRDVRVREIWKKFCHLLSYYLMCEFCAKHFYEQQLDAPIIAAKDIFTWMVERWQNVNKRLLLTGERNLYQMTVTCKAKTLAEWVSNSR